MAGVGAVPLHALVAKASAANAARTTKGRVLIVLPFRVQPLGEAVVATLWSDSPPVNRYRQMFLLAKQPFLLVACGFPFALGNTAPIL